MKSPRSHSVFSHDRGDRRRRCDRRNVIQRAAPGPLGWDRSDLRRYRDRASPGADQGGVMRRRAVVPGGAGFVGSHLAERLLEDGVDVVCLDNFVTGSPGNVAHLQGHKGFRLIEADVSDYISIPGPVDYVLNFASPASPVDYA